MQRYMPSIQLWQVTSHPKETTLRILCTCSFTTKKQLACTGQPHKHLTPAEVDSQFVATNLVCLVELGITMGLARPKLWLTYSPSSHLAFFCSLVLVNVCKQTQLT